MTSGMDHAELARAVEIVAKRDAEQAHRHHWRTVGPSKVLADFDVERCTREGCTKIHHRRREAS